MPLQTPQDDVANFGFDETPAAFQIPEWVTPEDVQAETKMMKDVFFKNFATQFHQKSHNSFDDYKNWVESLPQAKNPLVRDFAVETAKRYMPKKIRMQYASQEQDINTATKTSRQIADSIKYAKMIDQMQKAGGLPKGYYFDVKEGGLKFNPKMLPSASDPVNRLRNKQRGLAMKIRQADSKAEDTSVLWAQYDELDRQIDQSYNSDTAQQPIEAGAENSEATELQAAIQYAQENPSDAEAQQAGIVAVQRARELGLM